MTIKELAYSTQQHLQSSTDITFKRAHIYELLAASFGFNSYAAFGSETVFTQRPPGSAPYSRHMPTIRQRCFDLGYQPATANVTSSALPAFLAERQIGGVRLSDLVAELRGDLSPTDEEMERDENDQPEDDWKEEMYAPYSPILLEGLEVAASKGNSLAHYALALIHSPDNDEDDLGVGSSYWHSQAQMGHVITGVQKEWADAYVKQVAKAEKYAHHLREAARLGNGHASLDLAEQFNDPSFFKMAHGEIDEDPARVAQLAEGMGRKEDARHWLTIAAKAGDTDAMRKLIEEYDHENLLQCWTWVYLGQLFGTDLTQDNHYGIHEDGSPYDDDVGGTIYVGGEDGVELTPLSAEQDATARRAAEELFAD